MTSALDTQEPRRYLDELAVTPEDRPTSSKKDKYAKSAAKFDTELLDALPIALTATLGRGEMTVADLAALSGDTIITLDTPLNGQIDLLLNGRVVARGEIVAVENHFGVKVLQVFTRKD
jgi:flagellar motor switch protein FliN